MAQAELNQGEVVIVVVRGDYAKPRPAVVVQADLALPLSSILLCPLTSADFPEASEIRVAIQPSAANGLKRPSHVMVDKLMSVDRSRVRSSAGRVSDAELREVLRCISTILGID